MYTVVLSLLTSSAEAGKVCPPQHCPALHCPTPYHLEDAGLLANGCPKCSVCALPTTYTPEMPGAPCGGWVYENKWCVPYAGAGQPCSNLTTPARLCAHSLHCNLNVVVPAKGTGLCCPTQYCLKLNCPAPYMLEDAALQPNGCPSCAVCALPTTYTVMQPGDLCLGWIYENKWCVPYATAGKPCSTLTTPARLCAQGLHCNMTATVPAPGTGVCYDPCGTCPTLNCGIYNQEPDPSIPRPAGCAPCNKCCGNCYNGPK